MDLSVAPGHEPVLQALGELTTASLRTLGELAALHSHSTGAGPRYLKIKVFCYNR